ncbi:sensor histidine kinase [Gorillibacterium massiliense]|uniref:sensor histidine kinase n=1 Tax=Gorillibacterium massiliense TaxID=1280390 RepID=UPI0004B51487|nr:sensor histidine kinase [Gorillibacterium massiliense]
MKRVSLRFRLMLLMICLTTLPVVMVTWIATSNTRQSVEKELISANQSRMLWAEQYLNELIDQIDLLFYTLQINQQLMSRLDSEFDDADVGVQLQTHTALRETLTASFFSYARKIDKLTLYSHASKRAMSVSYADSGTISELDIESGAWSRVSREPISMYFKQSEDDVYAFHSINRFPDKKLTGGIAVRINGDVWKEVSRILKSEPESSVFLTNDEGELLSGSTPHVASDEVLSQLRNTKLPDLGVVFRQTDKYLIFMERIGDGQLTVVKAIPKTVIAKSALPTIRAGILTGGLFALVSIVLSIWFSFRFSRPIISLARTMRMAHIQNAEMESVQSFDEIGLLQHGYNSMIQRIKELIEHEYQREIDVKNAQLLALQAQINPHFLNNSLNLIGGMALAKDAPEIYRITRVIGDLLRYSISTGGDKVTLGDELAHIRNYLFIQEQRFAGRCKTAVSVEEEALTSELPKFILQPLVENAFEHGLQRKEGAWYLTLVIKKIGRLIVVMIKDNGVGMPLERLDQVRGELKGKTESGSSSLAEPGSVPKRHQGIGLKNVDGRIKLQFGEKYGLRLFSKPDCGTLMVLAFPATEKRMIGKGGNPDV